MTECKAVIFDVFGTVVDWRNGVAAAIAPALAEKEIAIDPLEFATSWRNEYQPAMQRIRSGERGYVPLDILHLENLERVLAAHGVSDRFAGSEKAALNRAWEQLPPWDDVALGLAALKTRYMIAPCSNGSIAMMVRLARFAGLPWDAILGADIARGYKPDPKVYEACASALGLAPEEVLMVAAHNDDLAAARACGLATAFIARPLEHGMDQTTDLEPADDWDHVVSSLTELAASIA